MGDSAPAPAVSDEARRLVDDHARSWKRAGGGPPDYPPQSGWAGRLADAAFVKHDALLAHIAGLEAKMEHVDGILGLPMSALSGCHFKVGDRVRKRSGSSWHGHVVGFYSTALTPIGYAVESEREPGSVQIYPEGALEAWDGR